jgi:hypothetical protein
MRRLLVVGCPGAGKSTFSRRLGERLSLPVIHLDLHFWHAGWQPPEPTQWRETAAIGRYGGHLRVTRFARDRKADAFLRAQGAS